MLYININSKEVKKGLKDHTTVVKEYLEKNRLKGPKTNTPVHNYIRKYINQILSGSPSELRQLNLDFYNNLGVGYCDLGYTEFITVDSITPENQQTSKQKKNIKRYEDINKDVEEIIRYDGWFTSAKAAYNLAENLNRNTCTYCNRLYTNTVISGSKRVMRPQFDHWFPKKKHPLLALSFYNLIPSCSVCNSSVKGDQLLDLDLHLHPYLDLNSLDTFSFDFNNTSEIGKYEINIRDLTPNSKAKQTFDIMFLKEMYNAHQAELKDMLNIENHYSKTYIKDIITSFPKANLSQPEVYRLLFGVEYANENFHKRPFSKFKSDILKELGIIKR